MEKVLILFGKAALNKNQPFSNKEHQLCYEYFYTLCAQSDLKMYRASYAWYDYKKNVFTYAWTYDTKKGIWKVERNVKPALIYDKTNAQTEGYYKKELIAKNYTIINNLNFTRILDDKLITSMIFDKWSKKSWIVNSHEKLVKILPKIKSQKFVIKPISESGGKNIYIVDKKHVNKIVIDREYIVQEFIDSSSGVPGIKTSFSMHDLRLVFVNETLAYSYLREPAKGSYLANLSQGGSLTIVPKEKLPASLKPILKYVNEVFETFANRVFSIDLMFDENNKPWIIELNSMPGLFYTPEEKPYIAGLYKELIKLFRKN
ncbi:MAG: ATP-grasp domain protein [Candidatus Moranbacteria bacterium GW2011_GWA2_39_41]|nr:MAG: ATP-grasp domain protein [Candidatus Moranbacteria bacterium GW2011_GWA2_39_41]